MTTVLTGTPIQQFVESALAHIYYVRIAGKALGVPKAQLDIHDESKFSSFEMEAYANQFFGGGNNHLFFAEAWNHHIHQNPHHWEHHIVMSGRGVNKATGTCLYMPDNYVREMIADWFGASMQYRNSWNMESWLIENLPKIRLHPDSKTMLCIFLNSNTFHPFSVKFRPESIGSEVEHGG